MKVTVVRGDITTQDVDAIVTAGNTSLRGGSGVNGAVHAAAGPRLLAASQALAPCPAGSAVITPAFDLAPIKWVIHAVGPRYSEPHDAAVLAAAYTSSLARADEVQAKSVASRPSPPVSTATPLVRPPGSPSQRCAMRPPTLPSYSWSPSPRMQPGNGATRWRAADRHLLPVTGSRPTPAHYRWSRPANVAAEMTH